MGEYLAGCAGERCSTGATAAMVLAMWQRTVAGQTAAGVAGDAVRRDIPRNFAPGTRDATSALQERKSCGLITSRGQCVARLLGRQPPKGDRKKPQELSWKMDCRKQKNKKKRGEEDNIASRWPPSSVLRSDTPTIRTQLQDRSV